MHLRVVKTLSATLILVSTLFLAGSVSAGEKTRRSESIGAASSATRENAPKKVTIALGNKANTLDPDLAGTELELVVLHLIGGTLYKLPATGPAIPELASAAHFSRNGLTQTYTLRRNLKFSDGRALTSRDVAATIGRSINDKSNGYAGLFKPITKVTAPNPRTVVFKLSRPYPSLPTILAEPSAMILPARSLNASAGTPIDPNFFNSPVSAGPYKLQSWGGGPELDLVPNSFYVGPKPLVPLVRFLSIPDFNARVNELRSGQIDFTAQLPPALIPSLQSTSGIHVGAQKINGYEAVFMNDQSPPLDNTRVRRAISLAIDRQQIAHTVFFGQVPPLAGFWPTTMPGYDPKISTKQDVAQAKKLLVGTPCASGCTLQLLYQDNSQPWADQAAVIIQNNLQEIGITVQLVHEDQPTVNGALAAGKYQLSIWVIGDYPSSVPDGLLAYGLLKDGGQNATYSGYNSPTMVRLIKQADESVGASRRAALKKIQSLFLKDQPFATIADFFFVNASRLPKKIVSMGGTAFIQVDGTG